VCELGILLLFFVAVVRGCEISLALCRPLSVGTHMSLFFIFFYLMSQYTHETYREQKYKNCFVVKFVFNIFNIVIIPYGSIIIIIVML